MHVHLHMYCTYHFISLLEYCGSRAIPSVKDSPYLNYIGENLRPGIDIMWTGRLL